jgi:hypothetical protein
MKRKKSKEKIKNDSYRRMIDSNRRLPRCSLCWNLGHKAKGVRCPVECKYKAQLIETGDVEEVVARIGNQLYYEVDKLDDEARERIDQWFSRDSTREIPIEACHLVLLNTYNYATQTANQQSSNTIIAVTVLGERILYAHQIQGWLTKNCSTKQRKKHCLSKLRKLITTGQRLDGNVIELGV